MNTAKPWIVYVWGMDETTEHETFAEANQHCANLNKRVEEFIRKYNDPNQSSYASIFKKEHFDSWQASISDGR